MPVFDKSFDIEGRYIGVEKCTGKFDNSESYLCSEKNVHKVLIIYLWKACPGTVWFSQWCN